MEVNKFYDTPSDKKKLMKIIKESPEVFKTKKAVVIESHGVSVVPYFKKTPFGKDTSKFHWSVNEVTKQPTITRKENYANGKWSEVPTNLVLPDPPISWLQPKIIFNEEEFVGTSTKKIEFDDEKNTCGDSCKESNSENESSDSGYYDY